VVTGTEAIFAAEANDAAAAGWQVRSDAGVTWST